jgi:hypothetical protein
LRQTNKFLSRSRARECVYLFRCTCGCVGVWERETERDIETERQRDRETERQRDRGTERQRDRETECKIPRPI